jgi:2-C-methyl-D-erythritol 4-phosphate cytidylyltransferase
MMKTAAIVPAAGKGRRLKSKTEKPYIDLRGKPILARTLLKLSKNKSISEIIVAVDGNKIKKVNRDIVDKYGIKKIKVVKGGKERIDSIFNGLKHISEDADYVLIHDGIRPFINDKLIEDCLDAARRFGAAIAGVPVKPTLKYISKNGRILHTPDRRYLWEAQTPQVFRRDIIERSYKKINRKQKNITDDSMVVESSGVKPKMVLGSYDNIKITTREDLALARILVSKKNC